MVDTKDFRDLLGRAEDSLTADELTQAQTIDDVENLLDAKFFRRGSGDRRTRYEGRPVKTLLAAALLDRKPEVTRSPFAQTFRNLLNPIIGAFRKLPIISTLRGMVKQRTSQRKGLLGRYQARRKKDLRNLLKRSQK